LISNGLLSVVLACDHANFLACVIIELECWSLIGQSIRDVRQQTRLLGLWLEGYWRMTEHVPYSHARLDAQIVCCLVRSSRTSR
jgi:hypothetical protein